MTTFLFFILMFYTASLYFLSFYISFYSYVEYFLHLFESNDSDHVYDYIIVGCGTAGSLVAHQLSTQKETSFLVLEAGGNGGPLLDPPALGPWLQKTSHDWQYTTVPQEHACLSMTGRKCNWPMGKMIGGTARLNNMVHMRSYTDEIAQWFNNKYTVSELDQYLKDLEEDDLPFEKLKFKTPLSNVILQAAEESGFAVNNKEKTGFTVPFVNQKNGARWTTSHALMRNHFGNPNSKVLTNAFVEKIVIDPITQIADKVIFERFGRKLTIAAKKGIILTSGAIGTPKLLLLSGIGPKKHLENVGIKVVQDLPVGENLIDHVTTGLDLVLLNKSINFGISDLMNPMNAWYYLTKGSGLWTASGCEALAILNTLEKKLNDTDFYGMLPDLQLMVLPVGISTDHGMNLRNVIGITGEVWDSYFSKITLKNAVTILPIVLHPKSVGTVRLSSNNPTHLPLIDPKYFSNDEDVDTILRGINVIKKLLETKAMTNLGASLNRNSFPGCESHDFDSRDYWVCYVKQLTLTTYHPAGTCRMGSKDDMNAVVDYGFKVKGINHLFVADASVFPTLPSGNINSAVALLAKIFSVKILKLK